MISYKCCICLDEGLILKTLYFEKDEITLKGKLEYVAPEFEWLDEFSICTKCNVQLDNAYDFKKLCSTHDLFRRNSAVNFIDGDDNTRSSEEITVKEEPLPNSEGQFDHEITDSSLMANQQKVDTIENVNCFHCAKCFKSKTLLELHINTKHKDIICKICKKSFSTKKDLRMHRKTKHSRINPSKFQCEVCGEKFSLLKNILEHSVVIHSIDRRDVKPFCCNQCSNKFSSSTLLIQHKKYHNGERTFVCSVCGKTFVTSRDLSGHEKLHVDQRNYSCDKCDKSFKTSQNLKTHIYVVHTDSSQWKYSCPVCSKRFAMKANCNEHVKRHQGNKDFVCHICKKTFVSNYEVKKHVKLHSNIAPFNCTECKKHYRDRRSLDIHLSKTHGIGMVKPSTRVKKFVCHVCPSQFYDNQKLQRHIRTHTGIRPFSCHECVKTFIDKSYLTHHLKSVHNFIQPVKSEEYF